MEVAVMATGTQPTQPLDGARRAARIALVEEHIRVESAHDMDKLMATMGRDPTFVLNANTIRGREGVHEFYTGLLKGIPDLNIETKYLHASDDAVTVEVRITGTHQHEWLGVPAFGHKVDFPLAAVFTFDADERLDGERVYYDTALMLAQMRGEAAAGS
jgi:steroid delta-isomerase-like uncharacterized protein